MALQRRVVDRHRLVARAPLGVVQRASQDRRDLVGRQAAQDEHLRSRQQRGVDLERRILGRRADQHDVAGLDARQERVLLRFVEAVDFVDEDDGAAAGGAAEPLGLGHDLADFLDAGQHGAERHESRGRVGDDARERRLAGAGRPPEDDRLQQVALDRLAQRLAGREQILLADELIEGARPHPLGQRASAPVGGSGCRRRVRASMRFQWSAAES